MSRYNRRKPNKLNDKNVCKLMTQFLFENLSLFSEILNAIDFNGWDLGFIPRI